MPWARSALVLGLICGAGCSGARPSALATTTTTSSASTHAASTGGGTGGTTGTIDIGCGNVSEQGYCNGTVAEDCYANDLVDAGTAIIEQDCATTVAGAPPLVCGVVSSDYLEYGVACLAQPSNPCAFQDAAGNTVLTACAGDGGMACLLQDTPNGSACTPGFQPYAFEADGGLQQPYCVNDALVVSGVYDQPAAIDCASYGGQCSDGGCVGIPSGRLCDNTLLTCAAGLFCPANPDGGSTSCTP